MPRLTKKQRQQFADLKQRAEAAERVACGLDSFKFAILDFLRDDIESIAKEACEETLNDARISY